MVHLAWRVSLHVYGVGGHRLHASELLEAEAGRVVQPLAALLALALLAQVVLLLALVLAAVVLHI